MTQPQLEPAPLLAEATAGLEEQRERNVRETMALLLRETRAARRRRATKMVLAVGLIVGIILLALALRTGGYGFWLIAKLGGAVWVADAALGKRRQAVNDLSALGDPRAVGALAVAYRDDRSEVRHVAREALRKLLPRVRDSDSAYIDANQVDALNHLLTQPDESLKVCTLKALQQVGDDRSLAAVRAAAVNGSTPVRAAAAECLPYLEERVRHLHESATLLRGSQSAGATAPSELLRPTAGAPAAQPEQLLRASVAQSEEN